MKKRPIQWSDLVSIIKEGSKKTIAMCPKCGKKTATISHITDILYCKNCGFYGTIETVYLVKNKTAKKIGLKPQMKDPRPKEGDTLPLPLDL